MTMTDSETSARRRLSVIEHQPTLMRAYVELNRAVHGSLDERLHELVKLRASQLNRCAFCLEMHTREGREAGLDQEKLDLLPAWREAPVFDRRERAALGLTDAITLLEREGVPDDVWSAAANEFDEAELAALVMAIVTINGWNRIAVTSRTPVPRRTSTTH
jgi:AhpD family alkylhydroperoxidase